MFVSIIFFATIMVWTQESKTMSFGIHTCIFIALSYMGYTCMYTCCTQLCQSSFLLSLDNSVCYRCTCSLMSAFQVSPNYSCFSHVGNSSMIAAMHAFKRLFTRNSCCTTTGYTPTHERKVKQRTCMLIRYSLLCFPSQN